MTLVTSAARGQDISIGAAAAIAGSIFVKILRANTITVPVILLGLLCACLVAIQCRTRRFKPQLPKAILKSLKKK